MIKTRLVIISDTHQKQEELIVPEGDILIHCGDSTNKGNLFEFNKFAVWFKSQKCTHKILIHGNHELGFGRGPKRQDALDTCKQLGITYLQDSGIEINGLKIFGQPYTPFFYDWEYNLPRGEEIAAKWKLIPLDTNVLITHGPPYGILDLVKDDQDRDPHQGCEDLLARIKELVNLKLHAFGHLHQNEQYLEVNGVKFVNAAIVNDRHEVIQQPVIIDLC